MLIGIFGRGRLGSAIATEMIGNTELVLAWHVDRGETPSGPVDVAIAASTAEALPAHLDWALATGTDLVIGTTGWELPALAARVEGRIGVLVAPNFSLAVALMARLSRILGGFAEVDSELDPFLFEHHHRAKADAPSGTAKRLAQAVLAGCTRKQTWTLATPAPQELGIAVLRAGTEFGTHTVGLDGLAEVLTLTHTARSRAPFARGALRAARWLHGRKGLYTFDELAQSLLDPLFVNGARS